MLVARTVEDLGPFHGGLLVPTMGALHAGHAALIDAAKRGGKPIVVSLFVNPAQFNDPEDFAAYPRDFDADTAFCDQHGVDCLFAPGVEGVYPGGEMDRTVPRPHVATEPRLEDRYRPGHFEGVTRVCRRLFEMTRPARAYFGEKDWQQLQVIRAMVAAESMPLEIAPVPTVREPDGLALSSRNVLLSPDDRARVAAIPQALEAAGREREPHAAERVGQGLLAEAGIEPEYFGVRDAETLMEVRSGRPARVLFAAPVGRTRLIDNAVWPGFRLR